VVWRARTSSEQAAVTRKESVRKVRVTGGTSLYISSSETWQRR
jgi:hypothetical protein